MGLVHQNGQAGSVQQGHQRRQHRPSPVVGGVHQHGRLQGGSCRQHRLQMGRFGREPEATGGIEGRREQHRLQTGQHTAMEQGAVQVAGQQHPTAGGHEGQQCRLQQTGGTVDAEPAVVGGEQGRTTPLRFRHGTLRFEGATDGGQLRQVPAAGGAPQQLPQAWGQAAPAAMGRQVQRQGDGKQAMPPSLQATGRQGLQQGLGCIVHGRRVKVSKVCGPIRRASGRAAALPSSASPSPHPTGSGQAGPGGAAPAMPTRAMERGPVVENRSDGTADSSPPSYDPRRDRRWLLLRPWVLLPRLFQLVWVLGGLALVLAVQNNSNDPQVQQRLARRILRTLAQLGPCFIKVGQALSTRPDLVRRDWLEELSRLQDDLPPFPQEVAERLIEAELGAPPQVLFADFPDVPVAAASLGQVYKARLPDRRWVAVKVQRPDLPFLLRRDLAILRLLGSVAAPWLPLNLGVGLEAIVDEFGRSLFEEIDYRREAANAERFGQLFADEPAVTVPRVEHGLSSRRVLTTQWINGVKMASRRELEAHHLEAAPLIRTGVIAGLRQLLEFGYFHADPHPGNLFALPGQSRGLGHMAYVDFGMMDGLSDQDRLTLTGAVVHLINRDFQGLAQDFIALGFLSPNTDLTPIVPALEDVLGSALGENVGSFNFKAITDRFSELMFDYPFQVPARFALIIRAVVSQEGLAIRLDPSFKILQVAYPYVARRLLSGDSAEMRDKLLEVIFDRDGRLRIERLENLLAVVEAEGTGADLLPVARDGLRLLVGPDGGGLRQRLLLALVQGNRLHTDDLRSLLQLLRRTFSPEKLAAGFFRQLNPLAG